MNPSVAIAIAGCGGFARSHHAAIRVLEAEGICRLVATCDPDPAVGEAAAAEFDFRGRGVACFADLGRLLDACKGGIEAVTLPTPVPLHAGMHAQCRTANLDIYLEKPPSLDLREVRTMLADDASAGRVTHVGFNYIAQPARRRLQANIASGGFGTILSSRLGAVWPRSDAYYSRNNWAARLKAGDRIVLDSPLTNALSHHVHNALFWAGPAPGRWARAERVRCSLLRARPVESADTVLLEAGLEGGVNLRICVSHAGVGEAWHVERVVTSAATVEWGTESGRAFLVREEGRPPERIADDETTRPLLEENLLHFCRCVRDRSMVPFTSLADALPFVELCHMAFAAGLPVREVTPRMVCAEELGQDRFVRIEGFREACEPFLETGDFAFARNAGGVVGAADRAALERPLPIP